MGLFSNYNTAGPGIPKMPQEKKGFFKFMEVFVRHFWDLVFLNLLYIVFCIPIVTIGPATAGLIKVARNYSQERSCFMFHDFWKAFKSNFKQALVIGLVDIILAIWAVYMVVFYYNFSLYYDIGKVLLVVSISLMLVVFLMHFYIYLLIVSTNLKMKQILKNAFLLTSVGLKATLISFFTIVGVLAFMLLMIMTASYAGITIDLVIIAGIVFSFLAFVICYNCYPIIRKYVIQPYYDKRGEKNPEFDYLRPLSEEEAIFEDKGGSEAPVKLPNMKSQHKKKNSAPQSQGGGNRIS